MNEQQQIFNKVKYKERRKELRQNQTTPEKILWTHIRNKQLGVKFRRQHGVGDYILDFFAKEINLAVEIDGNNHFEQNTIEYDNLRTEYLNSIDIEVIRFTNQQVMENVMGVCQTLSNIINQRLVELNTVNETNTDNPLLLRRHSLCLASGQSSALLFPSS